ncbi:MAG: PA2779 family protein [Desulfobacterales bacterium]
MFTRMPLLRPLCWVLAAWMLLTALPAGRAFAALVPTADLLPQDRSPDAAREMIRSLLAREEVQARLRAQGIDPEEARARVDALSDAEAREIARRIDSLPAGSGAVGVLVTAILIVFLVLLLTDLLGLTDVFPFVRKHR